MDGWMDGWMICLAISHVCVRQQRKRKIEHSIDHEANINNLTQVKSIKKEIVLRNLDLNIFSKDCKNRMILFYVFELNKHPIISVSLLYFFSFFFHSFWRKTKRYESFSFIHSLLSLKFCCWLLVKFGTYVLGIMMMIGRSVVCLFGWRCVKEEDDETKKQKNKQISTRKDP